MLQQNIIQELGLQDLSEDTQAEILAQMGEIVLKRVLVNSLEQLSENDLKEFEKIQETATPEEIEEFFNSRIPGYEQMVTKIVEDYKNEFKETVNRLKESLEE
jgi:shikimate kinase